jgi:hypothetical protein
MEKFCDGQMNAVKKILSRSGKKTSERERKGEREKNNKKLLTVATVVLQI